MVRDRPVLSPSASPRRGTHVVHQEPIPVLPLPAKGDRLVTSRSRVLTSLNWCEPLPCQPLIFLEPSSPPRGPVNSHRGTSPWVKIRSILATGYLLQPEEAQPSPHSRCRDRFDTPLHLTPGGNYIPPAGLSGVIPGVVCASEKPGSRTSLLQFSKNVRLSESRITLQLRSDGLIKSTTAGVSFTLGVVRPPMRTRDPGRGVHLGTGCLYGFSPSSRRL